jgi:hypothetical protein
VKKFLLDSSFLIDLLNEIADDSKGPAFEWLERNEKAHRLEINRKEIAQKHVGSIRSHHERFQSSSLDPRVMCIVDGCFAGD